MEEKKEGKKKRDDIMWLVAVCPAICVRLRRQSVRKYRTGMKGCAWLEEGKAEVT